MARAAHSFASPSRYVVVDRSRDVIGFWLGLGVSLAAAAAIVWLPWKRAALGADEIETIAASALTLAEAPMVDLAIARAEELNQAGGRYIASAGAEHALQAWREASGAEERYQLLSSFIPFSPDSFGDYMPRGYRLVLWEELGQAAGGRKVDLLLGARRIDY